MFKWLTELKLLIEYERVVRRHRSLPADIASMNRAAEKASIRFPNAPSRQETKALSELLIRQARGLRTHDA